MYFSEAEFISVVEVLGTFAFAVSGATAAIQNRYDIFGILVLAFVTATGGGTLRDLLIGNLPVSWLSNSLAIWPAFFGFGLTILFRKHIKRVQQWIFFFDAAGLGLFTVMGTQVGLEVGMGIGISIALGTITACFGGVLRDVLSGVKPLIFREEIYAMASIIGGLLYVQILNWEGAEILAQVIAIVSTILIRILALHYRWRLPRFNHENF